MHKWATVYATMCTVVDNAMVLTVVDTNGHNLLMQRMWLKKPIEIP